LRDAQEYVEAPKSTFRESIPPKKFPNYMALMSNIIDFEPSSFQEATKYTYGKMPWWSTPPSSRMMFGSAIVPRSEGKSIVSSKWLYKIKHATDGNIEKFKARFMARGFSKKREWTMRIHLL
jgi:hypothetical protein